LQGNTNLRHNNFGEIAKPIHVKVLSTLDLGVTYARVMSEIMMAYVQVLTLFFTLCLNILVCNMGIVVPAIQELLLFMKLL
jgi:hypothetical protein